jgi:hypothetical protein
VYSAIAIIKIICERVDDLKPWGKLLGEEKTQKRKKAIKFLRILH